MPTLHPPTRASADRPRRRSWRGDPARRSPVALWLGRGLAPTPALLLLLLLAACGDPACPDGTVRDPSAPDRGTARCAP